MTIVKLVNVETYYLRGTTWTTDRDRASQFATEEAARAALAKALKFMRPALRKRAEFVRL